MLDAHEIEHQQQLLATHRRTLGYYLNQQAQLGGVAHTPPGVQHGIDEARAAIDRIKQILREQGVVVDDYPDDDSLNRFSSSADTASSSRPLRVFLCHSSRDKADVYKLYQRLRMDGFDPWLDKEDLLPGQDWRKEIPKAVRAADVVLVCLSRNAIAKNGYLQQEIEFALDAAETQIAGAIYLIPLRLKPCTVPDRLSRWQWVDLFEHDGYDRLLYALRFRARALGLGSQASTIPSKVPASEVVLLAPPPPPSQSRLGRLPSIWLSARSKMLAGVLITLIGGGMALSIALQSFSIRAFGSFTNATTSESLNQAANAPTIASHISSTPVATSQPPSPSAQLITAVLLATATRLPTEFPAIEPVSMLPTVVDAPTNPPADTIVPTPKPKPTVDTQATAQAHAQATVQADARATADAQEAQIVNATQAAQATELALATTPTPTATTQPEVRSDITNAIRSFHVVEETKDSFVAEIEYSYNGSQGDKASISMNCPANKVRPGSICTIRTYQDIMTIGSGGIRQGMDYNIAPGDSFTTNSIEVCMVYDLDGGRYQTFLCRTFDYKKTWSN